jgi:hypothetical protein
MRRLLFTFLLVFAGFSAQAQFGIKGGLNFSNLKSDRADNFNVLTNWHVGILYEAGLNSSISIQPEFLYSVQGAKLRREEFKLNYFEVPVLLKVYLTEGFNIQAGPQFGMLLSESDNFDRFNSETFDFGITGGLEVFLTDELFVQARYYQGTKDVTSNTNLKNTVVSASLGFIF